MNALKVKLLSKGIFVIHTLKSCPGLHCYGGSSLLICDVIFREGGGRGVTRRREGGRFA